MNQPTEREMRLIVTEHITEPLTIKLAANYGRDAAERLLDSSSVLKTNKRYCHVTLTPEEIWNLYGDALMYSDPDQMDGLDPQDRHALAKSAKISAQNINYALRAASEGACEALHAIQLRGEKP